MVHAVHKVGRPNLDQIAMPTTQAQTIAPHWEESTVCNRPAPLAVHFRPADTGGLCLFIYSDSCTSIYCCTSSVCTRARSLSYSSLHGLRVNHPFLCVMSATHGRIKPVEPGVDLVAAMPWQRTASAAANASEVLITLQLAVIIRRHG